MVYRDEAAETGALISGFMPLWVAANMAGEIAGLGTAALVGAAATALVSQAAGGLIDTLMNAMMVVAGAVEGAAVGFAQWFVLRRFITTLKRSSWIWATIVGSVIAWLVMMPLGQFGANYIRPGAPESTFILSGPIFGLFLGAILGVAQWTVLRRFVPHSATWIAANALAWSVGMFIVFGGASLPQAGTLPAVTVITVLLTGIAAGPAVGIIHGQVMIRLLAGRDE